MENIINNLIQFWQYTGFANCTAQYLIMIAIGILFIFLAIKFDWEPMLLSVTLIILNSCFLQLLTQQHLRLLTNVLLTLADIQLAQVL